MAKTMEKSSAKSTEDWLDIVAIKGGLIEVKGSNMMEGNQYVTGIRIEPKNIFMIFIFNIKENKHN